MKRRQKSVLKSLLIFSITFFLLFSNLMPKLLVKTQAEDSSFSVIGFTEDILLSTDDSSYPQHVEPTICITEDSKICVGWKNALTHNSGGVRVSFTRSDNNGESWSTPANLPFYTSIMSGQSDPWLVTQNNIIYYSYLEYSNTHPVSQITLARSNDYGYTWDLSEASHGNGFADKETMTIDNTGTIYVTYDDILSNGTVFVRLTRSNDGGDTFEEKSIIADSTTDPVDHVGPYVTTSKNGDVFIAWLRLTSEKWGDIYFANSMDNGETFTTKTDLNPSSENGTFETDLTGRPKKVTLPVLKFDQNNRLYVLWAEVNDNDESWGIFLRYSDDFGKSWSKRFSINQNTAGNQWQPDMDIDSNGKLHIAYYSSDGTNYRPYYRQAYFTEANADTIMMSDEIPIAQKNTSEFFTRPGDYFTIRVDRKDIPHVVWTDGRNNELDIYYSQGLISKEGKTRVIILSTIASILGVTFIGVIVIRRLNKIR